VALLGWPMLNFPVALFEVDHNGVRELVLLILSERSSHTANQAEPLPEAHHDTQPQLVGFAPHTLNSRTNKERSQAASSGLFTSLRGGPGISSFALCPAATTSGYGKRGRNHATEVSNSVASIGRYDLGLSGRQRARGQRGVP
jgi:hypothetical protein